MSKIKKKVKVIKVDLDKCNGCRACEVACASFHAIPKYSSINPARARIRMVIDPLNDEFVPIRAAEYTKSECDGRNVYTINGKEYSECSFCGASCPCRDLFKEPDSGLPLRCDMCEDDPALEKPMCVQWCLAEALTYEEYEEEVEEEQVKLSEMETGLKSMVDRYGMQKLIESIARMNQKGQ
ncbi:MAG: (4Fe-4S)-binding protein [Thermincola sp.]|jgi:benzoyl-CoA reductase subunit BamC|nr:(4Fe-4S)-binding protein [Thermincola sp.]MDT3702538.1 (4Fe-4S)-binding protein [Thermincola sp.]